MNNLVDKKDYKDLQQKLDEKLQQALINVDDSPFYTSDYYLEKWNLKLNDPNHNHVDYKGFMEGEGVVQTPVKN